MKIVVLAGGFGTRLSELTETTPKSLVTIGDKPIIWHILKRFSLFGFNDFIIALGNNGDLVKQYFLDDLKLHKTIAIDYQSGTVTFSEKCDWKITLVDTGVHSQTGDRLKSIESYVGNKTFMMTYGDGLCDIDLNHLLDFHRNTGKLATVTAIQPQGRFGEMKLRGSAVESFEEKPKNVWISGGYFVLEPEVFSYLSESNCTWEKAPLESLCAKNELAAFKHNGFWSPMDTLKDQQLLNKLWKNDQAVWLKKTLTREYCYE